MTTSIKIFNQQIKKYKPLGLISNPYKYFFKWRKSLINGANSIKDELPWITLNAIDFITQHLYLYPTSNVFEFGGGGSTLFFLKKNAIVYTVEHDKKWFVVLNNIVTEKKYRDWNGFFIEAEKGRHVENPDAANPIHYATKDDFYKNYNFKSYSSKILDFEDNTFDIVLVDGRSRPSCIYHSISKIKKNGLLILDNSDRDYYLPQLYSDIEKKFTKVISDYAPSPYSKDFTHTTIWIKNK
jgi:hypothetical protein